MLNSITLCGRLTAEPEIRTLTSGTQRVSFTLAVNRSYKQGDEYVTDFIPVVIWDKKSEYIGRNGHKGSLVTVEGCLQTRKYEDKEGKTRTAFEVIAMKIDMLNSNKSEAVPTTEEETRADCVVDTSNMDEDLPF